MVSIVMGRAGSEKSEYLYKKVSDIAQSGNKKIVIMVPEQYTVMAERDLLTTLGNGMADGIEVISFSRMADYIFSQVGGIAKNYISNGGRFILMQCAYEAVYDRLKVYKKAGNYTEFIDKLLRLVSEFKTYKLNTEDFDKISDKVQGHFADKIHDLTLIIETYNALLYQDFSDRMDDTVTISNILRENSIFEDYYFFFEAFKSFSPQQLYFIESLLPQIKEASFFFTGDNLSDTSELSLFRATAITVKNIKYIAQKQSILVQKDVILSPKKGAFDPEIAHIEENLFKPVPTVYDKELKNFEIVETGSIYDEIEYVALDIARRVREKNLRYRDFAIITRNLDAYLGILESVFKRFNIPVFIDRQSDLLSKPLATLIFSAFDSVFEGYSYKSVFPYLKSGITGHSLSDIDMLENYVYAWQIKGSRWNKEWTFHPDGFNRELDDNAREKLYQINKIKNEVIKPLEDFKNKLKSSSAADLSKAVYELLITLDVPAQIDILTKELRAKGEEGAAIEYEQLWETVIGALEQMALIYKAPVKAEKYAKVLKQMLSGETIGVIPTAIDEVTVGTAERLRTREIKCAYIIGFNAGAFPQGSFPEELICDSEKKLLLSFGIEMSPTGEQRMFDERFFVYSALTTPKESLVITYPKSDGKGEGKKPSYIVLSLCSMFSKLSIKHLDDIKVKLFYAENKNAALDYMLTENDDLARAFKGYFESKNDYKEYIDKIKAAVTRNNAHITLSKECKVGELYNIKTLSPTRLEKFAKCEFWHFCQYGLGIKPRKKIQFDSLEIGTFMHYVIENFVRNCDLNDAVNLDKNVDSIVLDYINQNIPDFNDQSARFRVLFKKLTKVLRSYIKNLCDELINSDFKPLDFELTIGSDGKVAPLEIDKGVYLGGKVDRVDGYEKDGKLYLRIVDYKTGRKIFNYNEILCGFGLQMLLYLFALKANAKSYYNKEIEFAGVAYSPVVLTPLRTDRNIDEEKLFEKRKKDNAASGLLIEDEDIIKAMDKRGLFEMLPINTDKEGGILFERSDVATLERFYKLEQYTIDKLKAIIADIKTGKIGINPYADKDKNISCAFCDMASVCRFERETTAEPRTLEIVSKDEFWQKVEGVSENGN